MSIAEFAVLKWYQDELDTKCKSRDFYRCYKCGRLFSREYEADTFAKLLQSETDDDDAVKICPCGSRRYSPAMPTGFDWLRPSVLRYTLKLVLARGIAPFADKYCQWLLPFLNRWAEPNGWSILKGGGA